MKADKINMVINLSILGLLIYLSITVKQIQDKVFPDPSIMQPAMVYDQTVEMKYNIQTLLNNILEEAINKQEDQ